MNFKDFNFSEPILTSIEKKGFTNPTKVQEKVIPLVQQGKSLTVQSQTGSGKTHAFLLPLFDQLNKEKNEVQVVITVPSRELAEQIYKEASYIAESMPEEVRVARYIGGTDKKRQIEKLKQQQVQVVIGTPGRILDLVKENALKIYTAKTLVIDEADMTLDFGFLKEVDQIAAALPNTSQFLVFSATIPAKLRPFLKKYLDNPQIIEIAPENKIAGAIENILISTKGQEKDLLIYRLLTMGNPYLAFIFANTKQRVDELANYLKEQGLKVATIHGDMSPRERKKIMRQVQNLDYQYVVATDLAARGIDIEGISLVINDDLPQDLDFFIHRIGRTGRNQLKGTAITLYAPGEEDQITQLEKMGIEFLPKRLSKGELVDSYDRNRRELRKKTNLGEVDTEIIGLIKKKKKKIKPGYKKEIRSVIEKKRKQQTKINKRQEGRSKRKARKKNSEY